MSKKKKQIDLTPYENREALCSHFGLCGGCAYQKISYGRQLELKSKEVYELIKDAAAKGGQDDFLYEGISQSPSELCYRNKMEFTFGDEYKDGPFALGLHQKGSFMNIVNVESCAIVHEDMNKIRNATKEFFAHYYDEGKISFHNKFSHKGWLRHLLLRRAENTGEIMVVLVTDSDINGGTDNAEPLNDKDILKEYTEKILSLETEGRVEGIIHITNDSLSDAVKSDKTEVLYGRDYIIDEVLGLRFKISVFSFFQTNTKGAEVLYSKVREYAKDSSGLLFDLYSGTGTITQLMSDVVEKAVGVEIVKEAVEAAKENAELNGIKNAEFVAQDVLEAVKEIGKPDSLILDPPREGVNPKALGKILSWGVDKVVYVSCKTTSLARDLQNFFIAGYKIEKMCAVDMFPQTPLCEACVLLTKS